MAEQKAPNEKLIEILFAHYLLRLLGDVEVALYAPSTREEVRCGYDAKFIGKDHCQELYLQFKTPTLTQTGFKIKVSRHQLDEMKKYPAGTAFYVSHFFRTVEQIQTAQMQGRLPVDFLKSYIAFDVCSLEPSTTSISYKEVGSPIQLKMGEPEPHRCSPEYAYKNDLEKQRTAPVDATWCAFGNELAEKFQQGLIGSHVELGDFCDKNGKLQPEPARLPRLTPIAVTSPLEIKRASLEDAIAEIDFNEEPEGLGLRVRIYE